MSKLSECYAQKDKDRLKIGWEALIEINERIAKDAEAGITSPHRTALSEILEELSVEFASYHKSQSACRSYLRDSIRLGRYYGQELVEELAPYHLTSSHMLATIVRGEWPDCDPAETGLLLDWAIKNQATPEMIWEYRATTKSEYTEEQKAGLRVIKAAEKYLEITAPEVSFGERRGACTELLSVFQEI